MIKISQEKYSLTLNEQSGIVERLRTSSDATEVNLVSRDWLSGFGNAVYTRKGEDWEYGNFDSPVGIESYRPKEYRAFCTRSEGYSFHNVGSQFTVDYSFEPDCFVVRLRGGTDEMDQVGMDLNLAMLDLNQNELVENQFTVKSFSLGHSEEPCYLYCVRPGKKSGILLHSISKKVKWRIRYLDYPHHSLLEGLQFLARIAHDFDPSAKEGPIDMSVCVSFHESLEQALEFMHSRNNYPKISAPFFSTFKNCQIRFKLSDAPCEQLLLSEPNGNVIELSTDCRKLLFQAEGFYHLKAYGANSLYSEAVFHAGTSYKETFEHARKLIKPVVECCVESWYWIQAALIAHKLLGEDKNITPWLYDALINVLGQGQNWSKMDSFSNTASKPKDASLAIKEAPTENGFYPCYPIPFKHTFEGVCYSENHLYQWSRIQDAFGFVQIFLSAWRSFKEKQLLEYAIQLCEAHLKDHLTKSGKLRCFHGSGSEHDYTTVIVPVQAVCELYTVLSSENDLRAEYFATAAVKIADYLLTRDMEFPTEGCSTHLRWTEDGSIACTALSLLEVYAQVKKDPRYLEQARKVMKYHDAWCIETKDARTCNSSFRYWETMWEADQEGRDINCGHAWGLWQGEADFILGKIDGCFENFRRSYNVYRTNYAKFQKGETAYASFIPDILPQRPRKKKLYGCYPENRYDPLAYYLWPRLENTWLKHIVVGSNEDEEIVVLNGKLIDENDLTIVVEPFTLGEHIVINLLKNIKVIIKK